MHVGSFVGGASLWNDKMKELIPYSGGDAHSIIYDSGLGM
jgi:hypothetical protein